MAFTSKAREERCRQHSRGAYVLYLALEQADSVAIRVRAGAAFLPKPYAAKFKALIKQAELIPANLSKQLEILCEKDPNGPTERRPRDKAKSPANRR